MGLWGDICIVAGEASGDAQGALLVRALREEFCARGWSKPFFWGAVGPLLRQEGVEEIIAVEDLAVFGFSEVIFSYRRISQCYKKIRNMIEIRRPLAVIFIDYPGFNLKLLQDVYSLGMTTVYHIPPKVWSHGLDRAGLLKNFCHLIISIFPFEEPFFKRLQIPVSFVGNPLCDQVDSYLVAHPQDKVPYKIGLFPGSRKSEIKNLLPLLVESFLKLWNVENKVTGALPIAKTLDPLFVKSIAIKTALSFGYSEQWLCEHLSFGKGNAYDVMATSSYAWVCSGTATLETAFFHTPMSVVYKVSPLTAYIVKKIIFVKYVSLVNLIADQEVIPEYLQENATCENLVSHARKLLTSQEAQNEMQKKLYDMKALFPKNAAQNAAKKISDCIKNYDVCSDLKYHRHRTSWNL